MGKKFCRFSRERGASSLDFLFATALVGQAFVVYSQLTASSLDDLRVLAGAQYMTQVANAITLYVGDNASTLLSGPFPIVVPVSTLNSGYLPGYGATSPTGQTVCAKITSPAANQLSVLVMTDGQSLTPGQAQRLVLSLGAKAGMVTATGAGLTGMGGSWSVPAAALSQYGTCSAGAGTSMAANQVAINLFQGSTTSSSDFLRKSAVPGNLSANTMNTALGLATVTTGGACLQTGQIATLADGSIVSCQAGNWTAVGGGTGSWKAPVASYASLPASGNATGDARATLDNQRVYIWTGAAWSAIGVDQNGNMAIPSNLSAGSLTLPGGSNAKSALVGSSYFYGDSANSAIRQNGALYVQNQAGSAYADAYLGRVNINTVGTVGAACSPNGSLAQDGTGAPLACQSGVWGKVGGFSRIIVRSAWGTGGATAKCLAGETITGGGVTGGPMSNSYPSGNTWVGSNGSGMGTSVFALCAS